MYEQQTQPSYILHTATVLAVNSLLTFDKLPLY